IFEHQFQNQLRILAIRFLFAYSLRTDLSCVSHQQLKLYFGEEAFEPACMRARFHPNTYPHFLCREITVELLRFFTVLQSPLLQFPGFSIHKSNLLEGRVVIASLYLVCVCPIRSLCVSGELDRVSAGGRSLLRRCCSAGSTIDKPRVPRSQRRGGSEG